MSAISYYTSDLYPFTESLFSLSALESKLVSYISDPDAAEQPFDVSLIPKVSREQAAKESARPSTLETIGVPSSSKASTPLPPSVAETQTQYATQLAEIPEFASYGQVLHSSTKPAQLTERERDGIPSIMCQAYLRRTHCIPGTIIPAAH